MQKDDNGGIVLIKKVIAAISMFVVFVVTFAAGVGCIVKGLGEFSWDKISVYVSLSDFVRINDEPISELFSFSDHSELVNSHAEGKITCPTNSGKIEIEDIPAKTTIVASEDEYIHLTFDGVIRESCVVDSADNLTGTNIPNIEFKYNESGNKAVIRIKKLRANDTPEMTIAIPESFNGELEFSDVAGRVEGNISLSLNKLTVKDIAGKVLISGVSAKEFKAEDIAGEMSFTDGSFGYLKVDGAAGKVTVSGSVGYFDISSVMGNAEVESDKEITGDCKINDIMGNVKITLPEGSEVNVVQSNIMGKVSADNSSSSAAHTIKVNDVMGKVTINN